MYFLVGGARRVLPRAVPVMIVLHARAMVLA